MCTVLCTHRGKDEDGLGEGGARREGSTYAYDPDEVRWYRAHGARHKIGFLGTANAAFLALPREQRAQALEALAALASDGPVLIVPASA